MQLDQQLAQAHSHFEQKNFLKAATLFRKVNKSAQHKTVKSLLFEARSYFSLKKFVKAKPLLEQALHLCSDEPSKVDVLFYLGRTASNMGDSRNAVQYLERAIAIDASINTAEARLLVCKLYGVNERFDELEQTAQKLLGWNSYYAAGQLLLVKNAKRQGNLPLMQQRAAALAANLQSLTPFYIHSAFSSLLFCHDIDAAETLLNRTQHQYSAEAWYKLARAQLAYEKKVYKEVVSNLQSKDIVALPSWVSQSYAFHIRGISHEKAGEFDSAYGDFSSMAKVLKAKASNEKVVNFATLFSKLNLTGPAPGSDDVEVPTPVFMFGFPRSGTTLLDTVLRKDDSICVMSETDSIATVVDAVTSKFSKRYPRDIYSLSEDQLATLRQMYFEFMQSRGFDPDSHQVLIEKNPTATVHIPFIDLLFPKAKYVMPLRHPLDACLSNFQQDFVLNHETAQLISMQDCVNQYERVFTLYERYKKQLDLNVHQIRYEDVLDNMTDEVNQLMVFLGRPEQDNYDDFHKDAKKIAINTPSRHQVNQPLYKSAHGKWKRYEKHLQPYLKQLQPFLDLYGY